MLADTRDTSELLYKIEPCTGGKSDWMKMFQPVCSASLTSDPVDPVAVRVNGKKRKRSPALLFPGWLLAERVNSLQHGATIVGTIFELVVGHLLKLDNLATNSQMDLCPDGFCSRSTKYVESKACGGCGGRFLIHREQLDRYMQASVEQGAGVMYALWTYTHGLPVGNVKSKTDPNRKLISEVIENVRSTVERAYVLDGRIVKALSEAVKAGTVDGCSSRTAVMRFAGRETFTRDYLTVSRRFLERLRTRTGETLELELGLRQDAWEWRESVVRRGTPFRFNGVDFRTCPYQVFTLQERIPF